MKAPITLSKIGFYALASALFVLSYGMLTHLLGMSRSPTTIEQFLGLYMLQFGTSIVVDFYISPRKKSPALPEAQ